MSDLLALLQQTMKENQWEQQRILFHLEDVNDAAKESRTPHQMVLKAFPQLEPYWKSSFLEHQVVHHSEDVLSQPHQYSYFSNFPGWQDGQVLLPASDEKINISLIKELFMKIPRPYAFYSALAVLDGIDWAGDCDCSPTMDWKIVGRKEENWDAGYWPLGMDFDEICPCYQSNSVRIGRDWDMGPEITVQVEVFPGRGSRLVERVEAAFSMYLGKPVKRYARAVHAWEEREIFLEKNKKINCFFTNWSKQIAEEGLRRLRTERRNPSVFKKPASRTVLKRRFLEDHELVHYPLSRWDDKNCFYKKLPHNYHLEVCILMDTQPPLPEQHLFKPCSNFCLRCIGSNFELQGNFLVDDYPVSPGGDRACAIAFEVWQMYLERFEAEVALELFAVFGETPTEFVFDSRRTIQGDFESVTINIMKGNSNGEEDN